MQKYFVGLIAVIIAIGAVAFKNPALTGNKKFVDYWFKYVGSAGYEYDPYNWQYIDQINTESCSNDNEQSCVIRVDPNIVSASGLTYIIDVSMLNFMYGVTTLPTISSGVWPFRIPDQHAEPGLFLQVRNTWIE